MRLTITLLLTSLNLACASRAQAEAAGPIPLPTAEQRRAYWNQGKGEVTSYSLSQARYGELHEGHAVLVFVTEPFSRKKQVKLDDPGRAGADAVEVLKLNHTRKFHTGVYPYSTMRSVFAPTEPGARALKLTASTQEWCGHVFMQLGQQADGGYAGQLLSYFESEGDRPLSTPKGAWLEDELWTMLRLDPNQLPLGEVQLVPSATYLRLRHVPVVPQHAQASLTRAGSDRLRYEVRYKGIDRNLSIEFESNFPFRILGWTETQPSGWGGGAQRLTTTAKKKAELMTDYWTKNRNSDRQLREVLQIPR